ncbi:MAG: nucleotidyltransferase domain-containing protein [Candidatus Bathyarchaeales archaeon]
MASLRLRDRDAIITPEGLIFRVFGYMHPPEGYICDLEYAPAELFQSSNSKAFRTDGKHVFYKFYEDEAWKFLGKNFPQHMVLHAPLGKKVVGVKCANIAEIRKPEEALQKLIGQEPKDELLKALETVLEMSVHRLGLPIKDFGVFGSLLHGFYHPKFSDIDIIVYGRNNLAQIRRLLGELYGDKGSRLSNEFKDDAPIRGKLWRFKNLSAEEFVWHQRRKLIYGVFHDEASGRSIKVEFEPVKDWSEIRNEYGEIKRITWKGWVKAFLRVKEDSDGPFMPSVYPVETLKIVDGPKVNHIDRVVSYLEEFRMQAWKDEIVYAEGNLEEVETSRGNFHQITLTYGPRYYEQVLKIAEPTSAF